MTGRPWSWITGRPRLLDAVIVVVSFAAAELSLLGGNTRQALVAWLLVLGLAEAVILFWRRNHPVAVVIGSAALVVVSYMLTPDREPGSPALIFAVYAVSAYGPGRARLAVVAAAIGMVVTAVALLALNDFEVARKLLPAGATSLVAWVVGDYVRSRRRFFADLEARHRQEREQAAEDERLRIARELHDVVAHNVSAMAIQAGAARVAGGDSKEALASIEQSARDTLSELNKLLGVLRKTSSAPLTPQPSLADAEALLKPARDAGLQASLKVTGEPRPLPAAVELSAYRIVQEAVTNVLKHAGASRVEVGINYGPDAVGLTINDNGRGAAATNSGGHGLVGMRERVELFGGDLSTATTALGGFTVKATLPVKT